MRAGLGYSFIPYIYLDQQMSGLYPLPIDKDFRPSNVIFMLREKEGNLSAPAKMLHDLVMKAFSDAEKRQEEFLNNRN